MAALTVAAFGRALFIAVLAIAICEAARPWFASLRGRRKFNAQVLLLAPFLTPSQLIGGAFSSVATALFSSPWSREVLYLGILALKLIPAAIALRLFLPAPLSAEAWHVYRSHTRETLLGQWRFRLRASREAAWIVGSITFLIVFGEYELAAWWRVPSWTTALFKQQTDLPAMTPSALLAPVFVLLLTATVLHLYARRDGR